MKTAQGRRPLFRMMRAGAWYLPSQVVPGLLRLASLPLLAHWLEPDDFGRIALWTTTVSIGIVLVRWTDDSLLRFLPGTTDERQRARVVRSWVGLVWRAVSLASLLFLGAWLWRRSVEAGLLSVVFLLEVGMGALQQYARALGRARAYAASSFLSATSSTVLALSLAPGFGALGVLGGWLAGNVAALAYLLSALGGGIRDGLRGAPSDPALRREMLRYGLPFAAATAAWTLVMFVDRYFVEAFAGAAALGLYSLAFSFAHAPLYGLFMVLGFASYTYSVEAYEAGGPDAAERLLAEAIALYHRTALPLALVAAWFATDVFAVLTSPAYHAAASLVPALAAGLYLQGLLPFLTKMFVLDRKSVPHASAAAATLAANLALDLLLIPPFGAMGAAWATLLTYAIAIAVVWKLGRRWSTLRVPLLLGSSLRVLVVAGTAIVAVSGLGSELAPVVRLFVVAPLALAAAMAAVFLLQPLPTAT